MPGLSSQSDILDVPAGSTNGTLIPNRAGGSTAIQFLLAQTDSVTITIDDSQPGSAPAASHTIVIDGATYYDRTIMVGPLQNVYVTAKTGTPTYRWVSVAGESANTRGGGGGSSGDVTIVGQDQPLDVEIVSGVPAPGVYETANVTPKTGTAGASATTLIAANANRREAFFQNTSKTGYVWADDKTAQGSMAVGIGQLIEPGGQFFATTKAAVVVIRDTGSPDCLCNGQEMI